MTQDDARTEELLSRYRPVGPPAALRDRVLNSVGSRRPAWPTVGWLAAAAVLLLSLGLNWRGEQIQRKTAEILGRPTVQWLPEAEEAAQALDGNGAGRRYVATALVYGGPPAEPFPPAGLIPMGGTR